MDMGMGICYQHEQILGLIPIQNDGGAEYIIQGGVQVCTHHIARRLPLCNTIECQCQSR